MNIKTQFNGLLSIVLYSCICHRGGNGEWTLSKTAYTRTSFHTSGPEAHHALYSTFLPDLTHLYQHKKGFLIS